MLERPYIFFRTWEHFASDSDFPFEKFDDVHDDDMPSALEKFARDWRRDHTVELGKRRQKEAKELVAKLSKRAKQRTASPDAHYRTPRSNTATELLEPARNFSLGCRIAYEVGWLQELLPRFGDRSPSKRHFFMQVESKEMATTVVKCLVREWPENIVPPKDDWRDYAPLNIQFGCVLASQLGVDRQASAERAIKKVRTIKKVPAAGRGDLIELFQEQAAGAGMELAQIVGDILTREAEQSETPRDATPVADQTEACDTATSAEKHEENSASPAVGTSTTARGAHVSEQSRASKATSNAVQSEHNAPAAREDETTDRDPPPGEWSLKMTGAEAARRLRGSDNARFRDIESSLEDTGLERIKGTNMIRIRLDTLNSEDRKKIQEPVKSSTNFDHLRPT